MVEREWLLQIALLKMFLGMVGTPQRKRKCTFLFYLFASSSSSSCLETPFYPAAEKLFLPCRGDLSYFRVSRLI